MAKKRKRTPKSGFGHNLGALLASLGRVLDAEAPLQESLRSAEQKKDFYHAALTLLELGNVSFIKGSTVDARLLYERSLELSSVNGNLTAAGFSDSPAGAACAGTLRPGKCSCSIHSQLED
jgi:tetratricopeptide (TPR) repeat protein